MFGNYSTIVTIDNATETTPLQEVPTTKVDKLVFYSEAVVQPIIFCLGIIFNSINLLVFKAAKISEIFKICLIALTLTDMGTCIFAVSQLVVEAKSTKGRIHFGYWNTGALTSHLLYYTFAAFACTSSLYVLLVGALRAYMISKPHESVGKFKPRQMKRICLAIFIGVVVLFLPSPLYAVYQVCFAKDNEEPICLDFLKRVPYIQYMKFYFYVLSIIFIPAVVVGNCISLIKIRNALKKSAKRALRLNRECLTSDRNKFHITRTLLCLLILDTLWIMPYCIQYLMLAFSPQDTLFNIKSNPTVIFDAVVEMLYCFRPTYNIFVYLCTNNEYKQAFVKKFCCKYIYQVTKPKIIVENNCSDMENATFQGGGENLMTKTTSFSTHLSMDDRLRCSYNELSKTCLH